MIMLIAPAAGSLQKVFYYRGRLKLKTGKGAPGIIESLGSCRSVVACIPGRRLLGLDPGQESRLAGKHAHATGSVVTRGRGFWNLGHGHARGSCR